MAIEKIFGNMKISKKFKSMNETNCRKNIAEERTDQAENSLRVHHKYNREDRKKLHIRTFIYAHICTYIHTHMHA